MNNICINSDASDLLANQKDGSIKLIVTDPPYGIAYHSGYYKDKNPHDPITRDWNFQIGDFLSEVDRVLSNDGAVYLFTRWDVYPIWCKSIPNHLTLKNCIIWEKDNWSAGDLKGNFGNQYEVILFLARQNHKIRGKRWPNIWKFPRIPAKRLRVATEKPVGLLERAIIASSDEGDLVVDPYCGSGSTGEAAVKCQRNFLLCDIDDRMIEIASNRLGLPYEKKMRKASSVPMCPIMKIVPPEPALWGIHPEDLAYILEKDMKTTTNPYPSG